MNPRTPTQLAFEELVRAHMAPLLKGYGFKKSGTLWRIHGAAGWGAINTQRWRYNTRDHIRFTVNLGVRFDAVHRAQFPKSPDRWERPPMYPGVGDCHEVRRLGGLAGNPGVEDLWWDLKEAESLTIVVATMMPLLEEKGVPWVLELSADVKGGEERVPGARAWWAAHGGALGGGGFDSESGGS